MSECQIAHPTFICIEVYEFKKTQLVYPPNSCIVQDPAVVHGVKLRRLCN